MYAPQTPQKRPFNLSLNAELVQESRAYCGNLSAKVEEMLGAYVAEQRLERAQQRVDAQAIAADWNAAMDAQGSFADEHSTL